MSAAPTEDHQPTPEWDTSTAYDFCAVCGWPVQRLASGLWSHEKRNPMAWVDRRTELVIPPGRSG